MPVHKQCSLSELDKRSVTSVVASTPFAPFPYIAECTQRGQHINIDRGFPSASKWTNFHWWLTICLREIQHSCPTICLVASWTERSMKHSVKNCSLSVSSGLFAAARLTVLSSFSPMLLNFACILSFFSHGSPSFGNSCSSLPESSPSNVSRQSFFVGVVHLVGRFDPDNPKKCLRNCPSIVTSW